MRNIAFKHVRLVMVFAALVVAAGCGVKSSPGVPDDTTYPRVYPYAKGDDGGGGNARKPAPNPDTEVFPAGTYRPPPAATELPR